MAEWATLLGSPAIPVIRRALTEENVDEGERHLAVWTLMRIISNRMPYPHGAVEAKCLLEQWQRESGVPLPGRATLQSFEPWPSGAASFVDGDLFGPDPTLPPPFDRVRDSVAQLDDRSFQEFSGTFRKLYGERRLLIDQAWSALREADGNGDNPPAVGSTETRQRRLGEALAVIAVLRPGIRPLREHLEPWFGDDVLPYEEDPVMAVLEAYGVEILPMIRNQLPSDDPELRHKLSRLLKKIAGSSGSDCLLRSWALDLPAEKAERLLSLQELSEDSP